MFRWIIVHFVLLFFFGLAIFANAQNIETTKLTQDLMNKSGLNKQVQNTPELLKAAVANNFKQTATTLDLESGDITKKLNTIIAKSFKPDIIRSIIASHIESELSISNIKSVLKWLNSPLGKKITRLEKEASSSEAYKAMITTMPLLQMDSDYKKKLRLMQELDQHVKATETILQRELNMQIVSLKAMTSAFPTINLPSTEVVKANFENNRQKIKKRIAIQIAMSSLYAYRKLSLEEIEKYIEFVKTDYGKKYHDVVHKASSKAFLFCGKKFGENVGEVLSGKHANNFEKPSVHNYPQKR